VTVHWRDRRTCDECFEG